ncbi:hypothetical protein [Pengzhenrongella sicca]|uniref:Alpha/beta hydrolase n=1 Tax=Pengzhenrongella sicca TaxID=2819238 RepID=A0A8A4ZC17_9MICO|nr:hypothetical protein [Pengzhenrongella sicca]QTE28961.1 hypothetical protein J4E96_16825 [Pengzhenrongella sicca]
MVDQRCRAFAPDDATIVALAADRTANARIVSAASRFDPHVPGGSALAGATSIELATPGHFRALTDPWLVDIILDAMALARPDEPTPGR